MMLPGNDHVESFLNPVRFFKKALSPFELQIQKIAGDFDLKLHFPFIGVDETKIKVPKTSPKSINIQYLASNDRKKGLLVGRPVKPFLGILLSNSVVDSQKPDLSTGNAKEIDSSNGGISCLKCFHFVSSWALTVNSCIPSLFKSDKQQFQKPEKELNSFTHSNGHAYHSNLLCKSDKMESDVVCDESVQRDVIKHEDLKRFYCFMGLIFDKFSQTLHKFDRKMQENYHKNSNTSTHQFPQFYDFKDIRMILNGKTINFNSFFENLNFARMGGSPSSIMGTASPEKEEGTEYGIDGNGEKRTADAPQGLARDILHIPLSNVERLRATLSSLSLTELIEIVPHLGRPSKEHPDKKELFSVQDFFKYTETEGRRFFEELDSDGDGRVTIRDLESAMKKRKLPHKYAHEFMRKTKSNFFSKSFGWKQFLSLMEQKEPTILRAYTTLCLNKSGTLKKSEILTSLKKARLPANEDNAIAMMRFLNDNTEESISYGHFRNFMLLLPSDRLQDDPRNVWFEAATVVSVAPPVEIPAGSVLRSALAGGLASAVSTALLYPVDTIKTRVQVSSQSFPEMISKIPEIGIYGLYKGSVPAILGQFSSHGIRTGIFEASKLVLVNIAPTIPEFQVQSWASFCSTFLGTAVRIPCEVLKQRMQAGLFSNVEEAIVSTWEKDGLKGFFRGTTATLCREVPFYVAGMGIYAESKMAVEQVLGRELQAWETITVGAVSGGVAAVMTTPFDVMKTRMMTSQGGKMMAMREVASAILGSEGPMGFFKGALPRFFWIAPLGAVNFAGYELARNALLHAPPSEIN